MSELIKDLFDIGTLIERDSCPALFQWPPLNVEAVKRVGGQQDDFQAISLVFLLTRDVEQVREPYSQNLLKSKRKYGS